MRCPKCKKATVVPLLDPKLYPSVVRRCMNCGLDWRPLIIPPEQFKAWHNEQLSRERRVEEFGEAEIDRLAREIVDKRRKGLPVKPAEVAVEDAET